MMNRREMMKGIVAGAAGMAAVSMGTDVSAQVMRRPRRDGTTRPARRNELKKYDNEHYYKDGKFQEDVAKAAYFEMFEHFNYSLTDSLRNDDRFWVLGFEQVADFTNVGMAGIFWVNNKEFRYFGHEIYLLPGQMIPQHFHLPGEGLPAKHEMWQVRHGSIHTFAEGGEINDEIRALLPKSMLEEEGAITCFNVKHLAKPGDWDILGRIESPHFMLAGPEGAIVTEYGCYHSMDGLNFSSKKASGKADA